MSSYIIYTDAQLLSMLSSTEDYRAFTELYNRHWTAVYRHALKVLRSVSDAEDIVQEIFASLWKRRHSLEIQGPLEAYLYSSTRFQCIHIIEQNIGLYSSIDTVPQNLLPVNPISEEHIDAHQLEQQINAIVETLPEKMKQVFMLSRKHQLTHREIAERLNISEETVKKQVYNALKVIRGGIGNVSLGCLISTVYSLS